MSQQSHHSAEGLVSGDIDLYCLQCGYNLRGLSGDPRRCPECGHLNPMGDLELPAEFISAQLRRMETAPAVCAGAVLFAGAFLILLAFIIAAEAGEIDIAAVFSLGLPSAASVVVWFLCARQFRSSCLGKPGWGSALWRYHLYGLGLSGLVIGSLVAPMVVFALVGRSAANEELVLVATTVASFAAVLVVIAFAGRRAHRRLKEILTPLQREVAVILAREYLQNRLRSARRW